jgi:hypothetical protein
LHTQRPERPLTMVKRRWRSFRMALAVQAARPFHRENKHRCIRRIPCVCCSLQRYRYDIRLQRLWANADCVPTNYGPPLPNARPTTWRKPERMTPCAIAIFTCKRREMIRVKHPLLPSRPRLRARRRTIQIGSMNRIPTSLALKISAHRRHRSRAKRCRVTTRVIPTRSPAPPFPVARPESGLAVRRIEQTQEGFVLRTVTSDKGVFFW